MKPVRRLNSDGGIQASGAPDEYETPKMHFLFMQESFSGRDLSLNSKSGSQQASRSEVVVAGTCLAVTAFDRRLSKRWCFSAR